MINCVKWLCSMLQMFAMITQTLIGSTQDDHGCVTMVVINGVNALNECVRPWTTPSMDQPMNQPIVDPGFSVPVNPPVAIDRYHLSILITSTCTPAPPANDPHGCATWFDGCNHCMVSDGQLAACTRMMCFTQDLLNVIL